MKVGNKIKRFREQMGYSQEFFAEIMGVSLQTVSRWERGERFPNVPHLIQMAELFGCSVAYFFER